MSSFEWDDDEGRGYGYMTLYMSLMNDEVNIHLFEANVYSYLRLLCLTKHRFLLFLALRSRRSQNENKHVKWDLNECADSIFWFCFSIQFSAETHVRSVLNSKVFVTGKFDSFHFNEFLWMAPVSSLLSNTCNAIGEINWYWTRENYNKLTD